MAKWDFKIVGASFVKELVPVDGDVQPRSQSFMQPSFDLEGDKIVMKESGQYKTAIGFTQIGEIDGVAPTDIDDAYAKLLTLVENFNGGGGTPGTTPTLQEVLLEGGRELVLYSENDTHVLEDADKSRLLYCRKTTEDYTVVQFGIQGGVFESGDTIEFISSNIDSFELNVDADFSGLVVLIYQGAEYSTASVIAFYEKGIKLILTCIDTNTFELNIIPTYESIFDLSVINASSSFTALNSRYYAIYGGTPITVTDPAGVSGKGYIVYVVDVATTIGGVVYAAGDLIYRYYNGTTWTSINMRTSVTAATTGSVISFANPQVYNSIASPSSSNITDNLTGARIGVVQKIYHNAGTAPTVPAGWVLRGTGSYVTSTLNIIYAEWSVGTTVEYWITQ